MSPRHHPSEATILAYAAGALHEGLSLVVASHLAFCPDCRGAVAGGEAIGGNLLDELPPAALADGARDRVLARLDTALSGPPRPSPPPADPENLVPAPLARYLRRDLEAIDWHLLGPGMRQFEVMPHDLLAGGNLRMLRLAPGRKMPRHGHNGTELTLVLCGSYSDELGRFVRGDVCETDDEIVHQPISDRGQDCVCLIATEGPLKFDGVLARMYQRFSGL